MRWFVLNNDSQILAVHAALLPNGQILYFGGDENDINQAELFEHQGNDSAIDHTRLFDCETSSLVNPGSPTTDIFCCGHALLEDGSLLVAGGTFALSDDLAGGQIGTIHSHHSPGIRDSWIFSLEAGHPGKWTKVADMNLESSGSGPLTGGRWYPTLVALPLGGAIAFCGHPGVKDTRHNNNTPEIFSANLSASGTWTKLAAVGDSEFEWDKTSQLIENLYYPRVYLLPTGQLFSATPLHQEQNQSVDQMNSLIYSPWDGTTQPVGTGLTPPHDGTAATSVLLPLRPDRGYQAKVLLCGGAQPQLIDLSDPTTSNATWEPTGPRQIKAERWYSNAVLLPTGEVFLSGGVTPVLSADGKDLLFLDVNHVLDPEVYDPDANSWITSSQWRELPAAQVPRQYHSVALLMPDGRVWTAGSSKDHAHSFPNYPDRVTNSKAEMRIEIFEPWYIGGPRPAITAVPTAMTYGNDFEIGVGQAEVITSVVIIRCGSVTHSFNPDQRLIGLKFRRESSDKLAIRCAPNSNIAPPGSYLLFAIDANGVPSVGQQMRLLKPNTFPGGKVTALSTKPVDTSLFVVGFPNAQDDRGVQGSQVWSKFFPDATYPDQWSGWFPLGPNVFPTANTATALTTGANETSLFILGFDGKVWTKFFPDPDNPTMWSAWHPLNLKVFPTGRAIAALSTRPGETSLFVLGGPDAVDDHGVKGCQVWSNFFPDASHPGQWSDWFALGPNVFPSQSSVAALKTGPNESSLFILGFDGLVWSTFFPDAQNPGKWSRWFPLGGHTTFPQGSTITTLSTGPGQTSLYVLGPSDAVDGHGVKGSQVLTAFFPDAQGHPQWSDWRPLGPNVFPPGAAVTGISTHPGATSLYILGLDRRVWTSFFPQPDGTPNWTDWQPLGPNVFPPGSTVTALSNAPGQSSLYVVGNDGQVWTSFFPDPKRPAWTPWFAL
jgi:hypothetical protein